MTDTASQPRETLVQAYLNRRMLALVGLGFASGLMGPWGLLGDPLKAWLVDAEYTESQIGLFALVATPFTFNFAIAPLLDRYRAPGLGFLGRRRGWILLIQLLLLVAVVVMALIGPSRGGDWGLYLFVGACLLIASLAAAQDVVNDAYRTDVLPAAELGAGAAVFVNGYRAAMLFAGAVALALAAWLPWSAVMLFVGGALLIGIAATVIAPPPENEPPPPLTLRDAVVEPFKAFWEQYRWLAISVLAFIVLFKLPDALAGAMMMPLLLDELAFSKMEVATVRQTWGLGVTMAGALVGGGLVAYLGVKKTLWLALPLMMVSNLGFAALALAGHSLPTLAVVVTIENLCNGLANTAYIALLMSLCDRRFSATQYALFTSMAYFTGQLSAAFTGFAVEAWDYPAFFTITALTGLPALILLIWVHPARDVAPTPEPA